MNYNIIYKRSFLVLNILTTGKINQEFSSYDFNFRNK